MQHILHHINQLHTQAGTLFLKDPFHTVHLPTFIYFSAANFPFACTPNMYTCYLTYQSHLRYNNTSYEN